MKKIELSLLIISLAGIILVIAGLEAAWYVVIPFLLLLGVFYYFFGFALLNNISPEGIFRSKSYKGISPLRIFGSVLAGITISLVPVAVLFKLREYPMGGMITLYAGISTFLILIIMTILYLKQKKKIHLENIIRFGIAFLIILAFMKLEVRV
ncbi:MAG: hypothetical protein PF495_04105 [Spirochaetales bacterium]|jgi:hypothetical protein|nr:hypothetical protein [Spirochaetales bacterium]